MSLSGILPQSCLVFLFVCYLVYENHQACLMSRAPCEEQLHV